MANSKISNLPAVVTLNSTDEVHVNNGGTSRKASMQQLNVFHRGCLVTRNTSQSITTATPTAIVFDTANATEVYDTDGIHDLVTNPTRLTVPAGVTKVKLSGVMFFAPNATGYRQVEVYKNGARFPGTPIVSAPAVSGTDNIIDTINSPVISVTATDYFELIVYQNSGGALNYIGSSDLSWFTMEIIE